MLAAMAKGVNLSMVMGPAFMCMYYPKRIIDGAVHMTFPNTFVPIIDLAISEYLPFPL
jgi:hypothetical protein